MATGLIIKLVIHFLSNLKIKIFYLVLSLFNVENSILKNAICNENKILLHDFC